METTRDASSEYFRARTRCVNTASVWRIYGSFVIHWRGYKQTIIGEGFVGDTPNVAQDEIMFGLALRGMPEKIQIVKRNQIDRIVWHDGTVFYDRQTESQEG